MLVLPAKALVLAARVLSHCHRLGGLHSLGRRGDHGRMGRKELYWAVMWTDGNLLPTFGTEVMAVVTHFHAKGEECEADSANETAAHCCHSIEQRTVLVGRAGKWGGGWGGIGINLPCGTCTLLLNSGHRLLVTEGADDQTRLFVELVQFDSSLDDKALSGLKSWGLCCRLPCSLLMRRIGFWAENCLWCWRHFFIVSDERSPC